MIYTASGRFFTNGRDCEYTIRDGIAYERVKGEKKWHVSHRIGGSRRA